ncbi:MAG: hypothetical protein AAGB01_10410 [Cyanobacteria bacterium P01_F01_bin.42]
MNFGLDFCLSSSWGIYFCLCLDLQAQSRGTQEFPKIHQPL